MADIELRELLARTAIPKMDCALRYDPGPKACTPDQWELCGCATDVADAIIAETRAAGYVIAKLEGKVS